MLARVPHLVRVEPAEEHEAAAQLERTTVSRRARRAAQGKESS